MTPLERRVENLERLYGTPELRGHSEASEEARRRQGQETLDEVQRRLAAIAERGGGPDLTPEEEDAVREFYREVLGCEVGDDEYERRVALAEKYGAVFLAPLREQQDLLRRP
jgi:hypothetical protein